MFISVATCIQWVRDGLGWADFHIIETGIILISFPLNAEHAR